MSMTSSQGLTLGVQQGPAAAERFFFKTRVQRFYTMHTPIICVQATSSTSLRQGRWQRGTLTRASHCSRKGTTTQCAQGERWGLGHALLW